MTDDSDADAGGDGDAFAAVVARVRDRVTPDAAERERLRGAADALATRAAEAVADLPAPASEADVLRVGSTARGTWLAGDRDIDLFVRFPTALADDELAEYGLRVGHAVLPEGREEYAEHPYVTGAFEGFDVDLVPCYDVADATAIRSSVDRTPFHTAYLEAHLDESLAGEVRVFKRFLKGVGVYGSDLRTEGFSGYLSELLVVHHGGFRATLAAAADWTPPVELDPEGHGRATFDDDLVVIDPTDPGRNVAAVLSGDNLARFQHHARALLADPDESTFFPPESESLGARAVREHVDRRGTCPVALAFDAPDIVDDQLYPQLRRSLDGVRRELSGRGFDVLRTATFAADSADGDGASGADGAEAAGADGGDRRAVLLFELAGRTLPAVERHEGPPVHVRDHAEGFYAAYADGDAYGPFVADGRYVVERERDERDAVALLDSPALFDAALGARVETALRGGYDLLVGDGVADLADGFGTELRAYFEPAV
ncbi:CCA tRNA nucleotidyltransferase [Candidatus Halobonum tyrrellensis]|uniref:CCA-adding enzyme n=1 Tax=Candidatus Halobonum tyrrellensis G22 TaxID=1324957 RepID=V4HF62_9EURY|nr:CCA tRNA nucleotidyltransferase [Candidatus Halobonum tyrrellensis]ESP89305.1 tRNA CCA-pyrophosphorylase [Candidatus Halobonum tyrrellensis G22]